MRSRAGDGCRSWQRGAARARQIASAAAVLVAAAFGAAPADPAGAQNAYGPDVAEGPPGTAVTIEGDLIGCWGGPGSESSYYGFPNRVAFYWNPEVLDSTAGDEFRHRVDADPNDKSGLQEVTAWNFTDAASHGWKLTFTVPASTVGEHFGVVSFEPRCNYMVGGEVQDQDASNRLVTFCVTGTDGICAPAGVSGGTAGGSGGESSTGGTNEQGVALATRDRGDSSRGVPVGLAVAGGVALVGGAGLLLRAARGRAGPVRTALVDAYGKPLVVQDGSYSGGRPGQVWWNGEWIDPERAAEEIARQRGAIALRAQQESAFREATDGQFDRWLDRRAELDKIDEATRRMRELARDTAVRRQEALDALRESRRRLQNARESMWREEARAHERWGRLMGAGETAAEATAFVADRSIDVLASVTGPAGQGIKDVYTISKRVGKGVGTAYAYGKPHKIVEGVAEGLTDVAFGRMFDALGKQTRVFGMQNFRPASGPSLQDLPVRDLLRRQLDDEIRRVGGSIPRSSVQEIADREMDRALRGAARSFARSRYLRDPFKNAAADAARWMGWPR